MSSASKDEGWKGKAWNLAFLMAGALIAFLGNSAQRIWERTEERSSLSAILRADIAYQVDVMDAVATGLGDVKSGRFPEIAPAASTIDMAIEESGKKIEATFPAHKSVVFEANLGKLHILDSSAVSDVLRFYSNFADCEVKRFECQNALHAAAERSVEPDAPSPVCDVYLDSIKSTVASGKRTLASLGQRP